MPYRVIVAVASGVDKRGFLIECGQCKLPVRTHSVGDVLDLDTETIYSLFQCPECASAILGASEVTYSAQQDDLVAEDGYIRHWPHPLRLMALEVPEEVADDFIQAQRAFDARLYTAAALMARRALEGITVALGEKRGTLAARLKALRARGEIEGRMLDWADSLREVGNDAAHQPGRRISQDDARDLLQFVEALADYAFTYRARYERFKERRQPTPDGSMRSNISV